MQNSNEENLTGFDEAAPNAAKPAPGRIGFITAIVDTVTGAAGVVWGCISISFLLSSARYRFDAPHLDGDFETHLAYVFSLPVLLIITLCAGMLLFGGILALKRSGRGFIWSATGCALFVLSSGVYFVRGFSLLRDPLEHKWYLLIDIFALLAAVALGVLNFVAYRKSAPVKTGRRGKVALAVPILLLLFLLFGWYRVGTFLMLRELRGNDRIDIEICDTKVAGDVIEYKEDWGETELEHYEVGLYTMTVPKGYFRNYEEIESEQNSSGHRKLPPDVLSLVSDELSMTLLHVPLADKPEDSETVVGYLTSDLPVDLFNGTIDPFECNKMIFNTAGTDFSLLSTHNECLKLLFRLEVKRMMAITGSNTFRQEIRTEHLRGLHGRMIKPFVAELFDSQGRQMTLYVWSAEEELTPEHQRLIKNFIASIRPVKN